MVPAVTVWDVLTAYVPMPPGMPVSCDVIMVPVATPVVPVRTMPVEKVPDVTVTTAKVKPVMEHVLGVTAVVPASMVEAVLVAPEFANTAPVTTALVAIAETGPDVDAAPWLTM